MKAVGIAAAVTVAISLSITGVLDSATGCGSVDPTDPANYSTARIVNDTTNPVIIGDCQGSYCGPQPSATIGPNGRGIVNGACGVTGKDMTTWKLTSTDGRLLGYIDIDTPRSTHDLTLNVSDASSNRLTATKH